MDGFASRAHARARENASTSPVSGSLAGRVAALDWYHTIELRPDVVTPGQFDLRPVVGRLPLASLVTGKRVLDVGTHDGFWAFETERLGARSVTALDVGDPDAFDFAGIPPPVGYRMGLIERRRQAFALAHSARDSSVEPYEMSVYDLAPDWFEEPFDIAVVGTLLHHLRDPVRALAAIRTVASTILVNDAVSISLTLREPRVPTARFFAPAGRPFWWLPSIPALRAFLRAAGWSISRTGGPYLVPFGAGHTRGPLIERMRLGSGLLDELLQLRGTPHAWVLATA